MKIILSILIFIVGLSTRVEASSDKVYSKTGHSQFSELILENEDAYIINSLSDNEIKKELKTVKAKFMGKADKTLNYEEKAKYVSNVLFSRSNKTREEYSFTYDTSTIKYDYVSVSVKGNLDVKGVFKMKSRELTISTGLTGTKETQNYTKTSESGKLTVVIYPNKKLTLRIVGDCVITNGVQKNCAMWIVLKKGAWETITVTSTCYELVEEDA